MCRIARTIHSAYIYFVENVEKCLRQHTAHCTLCTQFSSPHHILRVLFSKRFIIIFCHFLHESFDAFVRFYISSSEKKKHFYSIHVYSFLPAMQWCDDATIVCVCKSFFFLSVSCDTFMVKIALTFVFTCMRRYLLFLTNEIKVNASCVHIQTHRVCHKIVSDEENIVPSAGRHITFLVSKYSCK